MAAVEKLVFKKFTWHNVSDNGEEEIRWLRDNFEFSRQDLLAVSSPPLRPKIEFYPDYIFIILLFPVYNRKNGQVYASELDIFLSKDYLVTVGKNDLAALRDFWQKAQRPVESRSSSTGQTNPANAGANSLQTLINILEELELAIFPMLNHIAWDIDNLDNQLFTGRERELVDKILVIKRNIVDVRKSMQSHRPVLLNLKEKHGYYFKNIKESEINEQVNRLAEYTSDIWDQLQNHKATIDAIAETNGTLITYRINDIMKTLTVFAVIVFPLTLVAAIFGMNTTHGMPFVDSRFGFWKVIAIMFAGTMLMYYYFKKHRWL